MASSVEGLPFAQRGEEYRRLAAEAMADAESAKSPALKVGFLRMASGWHALAMEAELAAEQQASKHKSLAPVDQRDNRKPSAGER